MQFTRRCRDVATHKRRVSDVARCHSHVNTLSHLRRLIEDRASTPGFHTLSVAFGREKRRRGRREARPAVTSGAGGGGLLLMHPSISHVLPAEQK